MSLIKSTFLMLSVVAFVVIASLCFFIYSFFRVLPAIKQYDSYCSVSDLQKEIDLLVNADTTISISNKVAIGVKDTLAWNLNISFSKYTDEYTIRYEANKSFWNNKRSSKISLSRISSSHGRKVILENDYSVSTRNKISFFEKRFISKLNCVGQ